MNQDFFSDKNKDLLYNLVKNKINELDRIDISKYPELKGNFESSLISVYRNGKYPNIVEFNKRVLNESIPKIRKIVNSGKTTSSNVSNDNKEFNIDMLINDINKDNNVNKPMNNINNNMNNMNNNNNDQNILNNINSVKSDEVRNLYERTVDLRTPTKEKPKEIDFTKAENSVMDKDVQGEFEKRMAERDNMPVFHEPPKNDNNSPESKSDIDTLLNNIQNSSINNVNNADNTNKIKTEIIPEIPISVRNPVEQKIISQHINVNSSTRVNLISNRYNYKIRLNRHIDNWERVKSINSIELIRVFIPIDNETIFDYPILNIKIPELDNIVFKMSKVSEIETNSRIYAVYNPVVNRGYFANKEIKLDLLNIRYLDFFNNPVIHKNLGTHDIINVNKVEFKNGYCFMYVNMKNNDINVNDSIQVKQILDKDKKDIKFIFNNDNHIIENIETIENKQNQEKIIQIKYPKENLQGLSVKNVNTMRKSIKFYIMHLNLQQELLFKIEYNV